MLKSEYFLISQQIWAKIAQYYYVTQRLSGILVTLHPCDVGSISQCWKASELVSALSWQYPGKPGDRSTSRRG